MLHSLIKGLSDIIYPKRCLACKNKLSASLSEELICAKCLTSIKKNVPPFCHFCGRHLDKRSLAKNICPSCIRKKLHFDRAFSPCVYTGVAKELLHEFKYKGKEHLGLPLSRLMIEFINDYKMPLEYFDFIVPVPLHKVRLREREFNQAEILAKYVACEFKKDILNNTLIRHKHTRTQTDLDIDRRLLNVEGSFSLTEASAIRGKNLLLVDDVLTTGATSSEAALTLKKSGANIVFVLTLAN